MDITILPPQQLPQTAQVVPPEIAFESLASAIQDLNPALVKAQLEQLMNQIEIAKTMGDFGSIQTIHENAKKCYYREDFYANDGELVGEDVAISTVLARTTFELLQHAIGQFDEESVMKHATQLVKLHMDCSKNGDDFLAEMILNQLNTLSEKHIRETDVFHILSKAIETISAALAAPETETDNTPTQTITQKMVDEQLNILDYAIKEKMVDLAGESIKTLFGFCLTCVAGKDFDLMKNIVDGTIPRVIKGLKENPDMALVANEIAKTASGLLEHIPVVHKALRKRIETSLIMLNKINLISQQRPDRPTPPPSDKPPQKMVKPPPAEKHDFPIRRTKESQPVSELSKVARTAPLSTSDEWAIDASFAVAADHLANKRYEKATNEYRKLRGHMEKFEKLGNPLTNKISETLNSHLISFLEIDEDAADAIQRSAEPL